MSVITEVPNPNLWDAICKDFSIRNARLTEADQESVSTNLEDYDAAKHNPVFYGKLHKKVTESVDADVLDDFDATQSHPACVGYTFVDRRPKSPDLSPPPPPPKDQCSPPEYLEHYIFPVLLPALEEMLKAAKKERCFERKRTKFIALDFLTEYLYKHNQQHTEREDVTLGEIPFVKEWWKDHPRPPLPLSLIWSEEEASLKVQSFWKGYKVRREADVQELRGWQREWREEHENIGEKVSDFWAKQMPAGDQQTPNASQDQLDNDNLDNKDITVRSPDKEMDNKSKTADTDNTETAQSIE